MTGRDEAATVAAPAPAHTPAPPPAPEPEPDPAPEPKLAPEPKPAPGPDQAPDPDRDRDPTPGAAPAGGADVPWQRLNIRVVWADAVIFAISLLPSLFALHPDTGSSRFGDWPAYTATAIGVFRSLSDLLRWLRTRYRITDDRVELRTGRVVRRYRWVPRDRIRSVDSTAKLRHRVAGLRVLQISSGDAEAPFRLDAIRTEAAEQIRRELIRGHPAASGGVDAAADAVDPAGQETVLARMRWSWFFYNAINIWAFVVAAILVVSWSWILMGFGVDPVRLVRHLVDWEALGPWGSAAVGTAAMFAIGVAGLAANFVTSKWDFRLVRAVTRDGTALISRHGLLKTREVHREDGRLRGVYTSEPLLWRWLGVTETEVISTGLTGWSSGEPASSILPRTRVREALQVAAAVLPDGARPLEEPLRPHPRAALYRRLGWAALGPGLVAGAVAWLGRTSVVAGWAWLVPMAVLPLAAPAAVVAYRSLGHTVAGPYVVLRCGLWRRATAALERRAVIGWTFRQTPLQRRLRLVTVGVATAAGKRFYVAPDCGVDQAIAFVAEATPQLLTEVLTTPEELRTRRRWAAYDAEGLRGTASVRDDPTASLPRPPVRRSA